MASRMRLDLGDWEPMLDELAARAQEERWAERLLDRDTSL